MPSDNVNDLLEFVGGIADSVKIRVEEDFGRGYVRLHSSEAERRQAKHDIRWVEDIIIELLRNARDARARNIFISTKNTDESIRFISVIDDGEGMPDDMRGKIFEPRVTSKLDRLIVDSYGIHGRGMALFSISSNCLNSSVKHSILSKGSVFYVEVDTNALPERKDQSSFPIIKIFGGRKRIVKGPKNINRIAAEFALDNPKIKLYCGSPAEILATLFNLSREEDRDNLWHDLWKFSKANKLADVAANRFGIIVSERNTYRIINGDIPPLPPVLSKAPRIDPKVIVKSFLPEKETARFPEEEVEEVVSGLIKALEPFASRYMFKIHNPSIKLSAAKIVFSADFFRERI